MELLTPLLRPARVNRCFSDTAALQGMLDFEAALAQAQAEAGVIPHSAAEAIARCCRSELLDAGALASAAAQAGNLAIPLVRQLTARVAEQDPQAARFVHWGATSQDAIDTGLILQLRCALQQTEHQLTQLITVLVRQISAHRDTLMVGRTWMQQALPTTLGLKLAGTLDVLLRYHQRLAQMLPRVLVLQFGGAAGTLNSLGTNGKAVSTLLAQRLQLVEADTPWHSQRDRLLEVAGWYAGLAGTLGKMARDISLLCQTEIAEVAEPQAEGRGGSSTMPHKRNPVSCAVILAAALRAPALVSGLYQAMLQEHERGLGGWHAEWESLPQLIMLSSGALAASVPLIDGLQVFPERMADNLALTGGLILAEAVTMALGEQMGRQNAHRHIEQACQRAQAENLPLRAVLEQDAQVLEVLSRAQLAELLDPTNALGSAAVFIQQVLARAKTIV
ncbi:3-carboxy-cis,cis-muconate cycloisomerase [Chania multitudinisentens RB-25]|uniref:3-carboxy-cis,cis-muconate cycloisomerase n=1 Tax=Chania multitudinisentens RB-25 TaxID=1441930 RepID=W0L8N7_9GAMM|nr:3-carboxy-cis,cis-muconate cycloisomerase [Chania multitudinisentens]AHG18350.1 3-carboxy-cis,cis-muconate cycloisomerase [Chania multitudinisentens RB-25]